MWQFFVGIAISLLATFVLRPKPQVQPPAGLNEIKLPTAEDGREIGVLFGCRRMGGPNVIRYGDLSTEPIKAKGGKK